MRNPLSEIDDDFTRYFEVSGYHVSWDFSRQEGVEWYEICDDEGLICQIDMGIPLADILEDLSVMATGADKGTSKSDYRICVGEEETNEAFDGLCKRVAERQKNAA